jgi:glyoxylase-like metal-dependent hydrolase (beta-lactamase superfamily II)
MRRFVFCLALLFLGSTSAWPQDFSKVEIKVTPVGGSVYMLEGAGGNIAVSAGDDGLVMVDDQFAPLAPKIQAALKGISPKPLRCVILTHWHYDHLGGNAFFQQLAPIVAQDNVRKRLEQGGPLVGRQIPPAEESALPIVTFSDRLTLHLNGEEIRVIHLPNGHTDGDSVVIFTKSNVVHMGDAFVTYGFPFIDLDNGGDVRGMIAGLEQTIAAVPAEVKVIPGHGPISTIADVKAFVAMLKDTSARVEVGIKAGKTLEQLQKEKVLASYEKLGGGFVSADKFIEVLYTDLARKKP